MTGEEKREFTKQFALDFVRSDLEQRSFAALLMNTYLEGRAAGMQAERCRKESAGKVAGSPVAV